LEKRGRGRPKGSTNKIINNPFRTTSMLIDSNSNDIEISYSEIESIETPKKRGRKSKTEVPQQTIKKKYFNLENDNGSKYWISDDIIVKDIEGNILKQRVFVIPETRLNYRKIGDYFPVDGVPYYFIEAIEENKHLVFIVSIDRPVIENIPKVIGSTIEDIPIESDEKTLNIFKKKEGKKNAKKKPIIRKKRISR
jgi:hypothetical protein